MAGSSPCRYGLSGAPEYRPINPKLPRPPVMQAPARDMRGITSPTRQLACREPARSPTGWQRAQSRGGPTFGAAVHAFSRSCLAPNQSLGIPLGDGQPPSKPAHDPAPWRLMATRMLPPLIRPTTAAVQCVSLGFPFQRCWIRTSPTEDAAILIGLATHRLPVRRLRVGVLPQPDVRRSRTHGLLRRPAPS